MTKKIYSIGIDVSKKTLDICFLDEKKNKIDVFKVSNDSSGIQNLFERVSRYTLATTSSFVMEATGSYHVLLALSLLDKNYSVKVFNPIISNKYAATYVRKCKTDKIDAFRIAEIGLLEDLPKLKLSRKFFFLRRKISILQKLQLQRQVLFASFSQFEEDSLVLNTSISPALKSTQKILQQIVKSIKLLENEILEEGKCFFEFETISKIKGISPKATSIILSYISDKNFISKHALTAFAGLDVSTKLSGSSIRGKGKISKRGNSILRKTMTQAAWGVIMHNPPFSDLYSYYKSKGKHYHAILVIIARKLLHIFYGMMKSGSHFDPAKIAIPSH